MVVQECDSSKGGHGRFKDHARTFSNRSLKGMFPDGLNSNLCRQAVSTIVGSPDFDEEGILRDIAVHFNHVHKKEDRRHTILEQGFDHNAAS